MDRKETSATTNILEEVAENEMEKFVEENKPERIFITTKECIGKMIEATIVDVKDDESEHKGKKILNKHLITNDEKPITFSLNGTAINKQIDAFFKKYPTPVRIQFTVVDSVGKKEQEYREFIAKVI